MTSSPSTVALAKIPRVMLRVLILLALSAFINFVDRGNLSAAAPLLKTEFALSDLRLGILLAAFFVVTLFFRRPPAGWWIVST